LGDEKANREIAVFGWGNFRRTPKEAAMSKKKIADSIIIRVGGGIREVPREPGEVAEYQDSVHLEPNFEKQEDTSAFGIDGGANLKIGSNKIIN